MEQVYRWISLIALTAFLIFQYGEIRVLAEKVSWLEQQYLTVIQQKGE